MARQPNDTSWMFRTINGFWSDICFSLRDRLLKTSYEAHTRALIQERNERCGTSPNTPEILFIHGLRGSDSHFYELMLQINQNYENAPLTFATHSTSNQSNLNHDADALAANQSSLNHDADALAAKLLEAYTHKPVALVGHSRGGHLILLAIEKLTREMSKTKDPERKQKIKKVLRNIRQVTTVASPIFGAEVATFVQQCYKKISEHLIVRWISNLLQTCIQHLNIRDAQDTYGAENFDERLSYNALSPKTQAFLSKKLDCFCAQYDSIVGSINRQTGQSAKHNQLSQDSVLPKERIHVIPAAHMSILSHPNFLTACCEALMKSLQFAGSPTSVDSLARLLDASAHQHTPGLLDRSRISTIRIHRSSAAGTAEAMKEWSSYHDAATMRGFTSETSSDFSSSGSSSPRSLT